MPLIHKGFAMLNTKHRIRLVYAYKFVEERNLLLVGCAHKSEELLGLYVKFGIDDCADVMNLDSQSVDLVLAGLEAGMEQEEIARETGVSSTKVEEMAELRRRTYHMRRHSMVPEIPREVLFGPQ